MSSDSDSDDSDPEAVFMKKVVQSIEDDHAERVAFRDQISKSLKESTKLNERQVCNSEAQVALQARLVDVLERLLPRPAYAA